MLKGCSVLRLKIFVIPMAWNEILKVMANSKAASDN